MTSRTIKSPPQLYLFYGEEGYLIQEQVKELVASLLMPEEQDFNLIALEADPPLPELLQQVESAPFFGERKVVVVRNSKLFQASRRKAAANEEVDDDASSPDEEEKEGPDAADPRLAKLFADMPPYATLIFTATKADKRRKIMKLMTEYGVIKELNPFRPLEEREIRQWVEGKMTALNKRLQREAMDHLLAVVGTMNRIPRGFLAAELEKAALYVGGAESVDKKAMEAVLSAVPEVSAFAMTEALARRNVAQSLMRLEELFVNREPPLKIIGLLAFKVRQWWQVRQIMDRKGTDEEMLTILGAKNGRPGMSHRVIAQSRSFRAEALKNALLTLAQANASIRSGIDPKLYLERVIIELCK